MSNFSYIAPTGKMRFPVKAWNKGVEFDAGTYEQLSNIASLPIVHKHVAAMPDAHVGIGATVGSVIATKGAVIPAAVGVDLGCGMMAWRLSLKESDLPDSLGHVRSAMERATPHGRTNNGEKGDRGAWGTSVPVSALNRWTSLLERYEAIIAKHPKAKSYNGLNHLGTLGTGNHFIELCADENQDLWVMLHSGSRGIGNRIGSYFIEQAKREMERYHVIDYLPGADCSYLVEHTNLFDDYVEAVQWAQDFAWENRKQMMQQTLHALREILPPFTVTEEAVNCHHNYISREHHFGENVIVTRKGAVRAREGDLGIIPGSMATGSFIVRGKGNPESFCSCSHGAGRRMSRTQAFKAISVEDHIKATEGVECRKDKDVIDESPAAYKDLGAVLAAQSDLVDIVHRLRTLVNVKG
ncbi:tRNA splicing ligase [Mesorhizobium phage Cp1R7A-A1]|nr:tRNA splicing ligase [Mesorhizobium phage Cp1R7A-A1]